EKYVMEYPSRLFGITKTEREGEWGFGDVAYERTSFAVREQGKEFVGTAAALYGISAAVYLSLLGREGLRELAVQITSRSHYAASALANVAGVRLKFGAPFFREFVVELPFAAAAVKDDLSFAGIRPGVSCGRYYDGMENCLLVSVTECHSRGDIDTLASALEAVIADRRGS
ncbi:MAG: aminomethyl-transferring glycine dehydrogenase, partial [Candidatus Eisenbacteria sp.]|nr:aminomethyl-transferring glycine dehydrogenase [Candidatus Eisenbacteria bacterium]